MQKEKKQKYNWAVFAALCVMLAIVLALAIYTIHGLARAEECEDTSVESPYGTMISGISSQGIEFYWKKPESVDGYEIFRSYTRDSGYSRIAMIRDSTQGTYLDNDFDHTEYKVYYKIRSYVKAKDGKHYSAFTPPQRAKYRTSLKLGNQKLFVRLGKDARLTAYYGWGEATGLTWSVSDPMIAKVSSKGKVRGLASGTCTVTCYSASLDMQQECRVIVDRAPLPMLESTQDLTQQYKDTGNGYWDDPNDDNDDNAVIMMVGDMMCTGAQQGLQGYDTGEYDFNGSYKEVQPLLSGADLTVGNLETTLSSTWPYMHESGYINNKANCNAPSRYLDALKYAGVDGVVMANNHNCDAGEDGLQETIDQVERYELAHTGVFHSDRDQRYMMFDVNGIRVGFLSYVSEITGYNGKDEDWPKKSVQTNLNYYSKRKAKADMQTLRENGAEYVIVYMHWGVKNAQTVKPSQKQAAQELADVGADYIVGSHCHLLQKYVELKAADGRIVPCFYSLGDFQSSIEQIPGNRDSAILRIRLKRHADGSIYLAKNYYIPCYTFTEYGGDYYVTVPVTEALSDYDTIHTRIVDAVGTDIAEKE